MRKTLVMLACLAIVLVQVATLMASVSKTIELTVPFSCVPDVSGIALTFTGVDPSDPYADSTTEDCGMFWSDELEVGSHANAKTEFTVQITKFKLTVGGITYELDSAVKCAGVIAQKITSWTVFHGAYGGYTTGEFKVGVARRGLADHAGTYIATLEICCSPCSSCPPPPP